MMDFWLRPFSVESWQAFQNTECTLIGFRSQHWTRARQMRSGDVILCYVQRIKRWVGALEILAPAYRDSASDFEGGVWSVRCRVRSRVVLDIDHGVPMASLGGLLSFHRDESLPARLALFFQRMLARFDEADGRLIQEHLLRAAAEPIANPLAYYPLAPRVSVCRSEEKGQAPGSGALVTIPESMERMDSETGDGLPHAEMQWQLLQLGARLDQQMWIPIRDRSQPVNGTALGDAPNLLEQLPSLSNVSVAVYRTIEEFDCLWIRDNMIMAAFEVEQTPSLHGGLLRMRDLVALAPRTNIAMYLVAPDEHFEFFMREITRPSFSLGEVPLHTVCGFLPFSALKERTDKLDDITPTRLNEVLDEIAEFYDPADDTTAHSR